jgi:hypothetical protein
MERMIPLNERSIDLSFGERMISGGFFGDKREEESSSRSSNEAPVIESLEVMRSKSWNSLITVLTSLPSDDPHWLYKTPFGCGLFYKNGDGYEPVKRFRGEIFSLFRERLLERCLLMKDRKEWVIFLTERYTRRQGIFKIKYLGAMDKEMVRIERVRTFSKEEFIRAYPQWSRRLKDLKFILDEYPRLILGGKEGSFVKKCCYSIIMEKIDVSEFPPPLFIEESLELHFPMVLQLWNGEEENFGVELFEGIEFPYLFYESRDSSFIEERSLLTNFLICAKHLILCLPFSSPEAMREALLEAKDKKLIGFKAYFLSPLELTEV